MKRFLALFRKKTKFTISKEALQVKVNPKEIVDLRKTLFEENNPYANFTTSPEEKRRRFIINRTWNNYRALVVAEENRKLNERLQFKIAAMHELERVAPHLLQKALSAEKTTTRGENIGIPPIDRILPTLTPPTRMPFQ